MTYVMCTKLRMQELNIYDVCYLKYNNLDGFGFGVTFKHKILTTCQIKIDIFTATL